MEKSIKISDVKGVRENPFLDPKYMQLSIKNKNMTRGSLNQYIVTDENDEVVSNSAVIVRERIEFDNDQFAKLFMDQIRIFVDLSRPGMQLLFWIVRHLRQNDDKVYIFMEDVMQDLGWASSTSYYDTLAELLSKDVIYPSYQKMFWFINPAMMFNGDRMVLVQEYVKKGSVNGSLRKGAKQLTSGKDPLKNLDWNQKRMLEEKPGIDVVTRKVLPKTENECIPPANGLPETENKGDYVRFKGK